MKAADLATVRNIRLPAHHFELMNFEHAYISRTRPGVQKPSTLDSLIKLAVSL